jgi:hypothetical protein
MEAMHERCAGLDVHKKLIVACIRVTIGHKVERECRTFDTTTTGLLAFAVVAVGIRLYTCRHGSDRGLLEASMEHPE